MMVPKTVMKTQHWNTELKKHWCGKNIITWIHQWNKVVNTTLTQNIKNVKVTPACETVDFYEIAP